jgi:hypothetical protein
MAISWSDGAMECWSNGKNGGCSVSNIPILQYSITPKNIAELFA